MHRQTPAGTKTVIDWIHKKMLIWGQIAAAQEDGAGYPKSSPIDRLGMPARAGSTFGQDYGAQDRHAAYSEVQSCLVRVEPIKKRAVVATLYKNGHHLSRTAGLLGCHRTTVSEYRDSAHIQIAQMLSW